MNRFYKTIKTILKPIVKFLFGYEVNGLENFPTHSKFLLCCNHQSFWDVVLLIVTCPYQINFMAKKELFENKLVAYIFEKMGAFPVNRATGDINALKKAYDILEGGGVLGIFPEGTRHDVGAPGKAKAGAAMLAIDAGADILPMAIHYSQRPFLFKKVSVRVGEIIRGDSFIKSTPISKNEIRRVTTIIMQNITSLWEKKF